MLVMYASFISTYLHSINAFKYTKIYIYIYSENIINIPIYTILIYISIISKLNIMYINITLYYIS